jgi:hypothetical protein
MYSFGNQFWHVFSFVLEMCFFSDVKYYPKLGLNSDHWFTPIYFRRRSVYITKLPSWDFREPVFFIFCQKLCSLTTNCLAWYCSYLSEQSQDPSWSISLSYRSVWFSWLRCPLTLLYLFIFDEFCNAVIVSTAVCCLLQVDEDPGIRTNTTILLGNIASHMNDGVCLKDTTILFPVFHVDLGCVCAS